MISFTGLFKGFYPDFKTTVLTPAPPLQCSPHLLTQALR